MACRYLLVLAIISCVGGDDALEIGVEQRGAAACPKWSCTSNDPMVTSTLGPSVQFHELNEKGLPNREGVVLLGLEVGSNLYAVDVAGAKLYGKKLGAPTISGQGLVGTHLRIKAGGITYRLAIEAVGTTFLYPKDGSTTETYRVSYRAVGDPDIGPWPNLCSRADRIPESDPGDPVGQNRLGMNRWTLVLYEGERVDADLKRIDPTIQKDWFTIGCAGHVLAKTHIVRHTWVSQSSAFANTRDERQALLKMYVGDYCNDGTPFTVSGEPLVWIDHRNWFAYGSGGPLRLEARWGPNGPICLEEPRLLVTADPVARTVFPDIEGAIAGRCARPPRCSALHHNTDVYQTFGAHIVSANPP